MSSKPITYVIPLPYKSQAAKRKSDVLMTINVQRNLHYKAAANFKLRYGATLRKVILSHPLPQFEAVKIHYLIKTKPTKGKPTKALPYRGSEPRNFDLLNVGAVVSKVLLDVLEELKIIPNDKIKYVIEEHFISSPWESEESIKIILEPTTPIVDPRITK